jgi:putative hydrolase
VSDIPFGFGKPDKPDEPNDGGENAGGGSHHGAGSGAGGGSGGEPGDQPQRQPYGAGMDQLAEMLRQFANMLTSQGSGGPLNWELAKDIARHAAAEEGGDPSVVDAERKAVVEALRLADHWLDGVTSLPAGIRSAQAWSRAEWIENTLPVWSKLCDPIAARMVKTLDAGLPSEMQAMAGPLLGMIRQMAGMMVAGQAGQGLGTLAKEVVGSSDVGLPLAPEGVGALLPRGVSAFGAGLEVPEDEVRVFLALREAAHQRLFAHVPWLRPALLGAVEEYARGITVDLSRLQDAVSGIDPSDPEALQRALGGELSLEPEETPQQKAALSRLETLLALVEGWVDTVVEAAAEGRLPAGIKLAEAVRRRRATGGPAERTFAALVGLELRPRRMREAATLWRELGKERGDARDAVWGHPDLMPTADDLDDPGSFAARERADSDLDISALGTEPPEPSSGTGEGPSGEDGGGADQQGDGEDKQGDGT